MAGWFIPATSVPTEKSAAKKSPTKKSPAKSGLRSPIVILLHPVRADRRAMLERAVLLREHGFSTLLIDLQAHGENPGDAITMGYRESHSVRDAVAWARARNPGQPVGIIGWSLGGAATLLATPLEVDAIAIESVFPEITQAVHNRVSRRLGPLHRLLAPALLAQLRPRLGFGPADVRPIDRIAACGCPVLIACGEHDEHTTLEESRRLFEAATEPKRLLVFEGAKHEDLLRFGRRQYEQSVVGFLSEHLQRTKR